MGIKPHIISITYIFGEWPAEIQHYCLKVSPSGGRSLTFMIIFELCAIILITVITVILINTAYRNTHTHVTQSSVALLARPIWWLITHLWWYVCIKWMWHNASGALHKVETKLSIAHHTHPVWSLRSGGASGFSGNKIQIAASLYNSWHCSLLRAAVTA